MTTVFFVGQDAPVAIGLMNALWNRVTEQSSGTSTTSLAVTTGSVTLTTQPDKQFAIGQPVRITRTSNVLVWMDGQITAYNATSGVMDVLVATTSGAGTFTDWTIAMSGQAGPIGQKGWSPLLASVVDGERRVAQVADWEGGEGAKPAVGLYIGPTGLVSDIALATDVRGGPGADGTDGQDGATGPSNVLSIGSVTSGPTASATITGTSPAQVLDLVLPKGNQGDKGDTGDTGSTGPANQLTVGTVTTGAAGSSAVVDITGVAPSQTVNFTIPRGDKGVQGDTGDTGPAGLTPRGPWVGTTPYLVNDLVEYNGSSYLRIIAGTTPTNPAADATNWQLFVSRGTDGTGAVSSVNSIAPDINGDVVIPDATAVAGGMMSAADKSKLNGIAENATANATDAYLLDRANQTGTQAMSTVTGLTGALDAKVEKVPGKGLSQEDFTTVLKAKLAGLEGNHWRGEFITLAALIAGVTDPVAGDSAYVDPGTGQPAQQYIWDASDSEWVLSTAPATPLTNADIKLKYEANPDTNAFTDAEKAKLLALVAASAAEVLAGTNTGKFANPKNLDDAVAFVALTGASPAPDFNVGRNFTLALSANTTLGNPTNARPGQTGEIVITQDSTPRTLSFGANWKIKDGVPSVSTEAGAVNLLSFKVVTPTMVMAVFGTGF